MSKPTVRAGATRRHCASAWGACAIALLVVACKPAEVAKAPPDRPVRTLTVEKRDLGESVTLTGNVLAKEEVSLAFRIGGRMIERKVNVGDVVVPDQVVARLDPETPSNVVRAARAELAAARGQLTEARNNFDRQRTLLDQGWTTRVNFDQAQQRRQTAQSQVDAAQAQLNNAEINLSYTELHADSGGSVTARGAEPGEVVAPGQMIVQLARKGGRDAVFDVPARVIQAAPADPLITIVLTSDPTVRATGRVREVAPQADPVTRTFQVRVGLIDPPEAMRLGSTVSGTMQLDATRGIEIPASALTSANRQPAVWVVDPATRAVALRNVDVARFDPARVVVSQGLQPGDVVVTAGVQALKPGQKVRLLGAGP